MNRGATTAKKLCALSVDLDPLTAYYEIHGLGDPPRQVRHTIMRHALPRFEALFEEAGVRATLFVVGRELEQSDAMQQVLRRMADAGHEIGNHTYDHPYELCRLPEQVIEQEVRRAHEVVAKTIGREHAPVGFRSPGYFVNAKVMRALELHGYRYDSSMFPSPPYYLAKLGVLFGMALRGRRSGAVVSDPRGLTAPPDPYRPDSERPWHHGSATLVELPVAVMPGLRLPAIGTMLAAGPSWARTLVLRSMARRGFFNLELHGIDLSDAVADRIPTELAGRQPDLRVPVSNKREIFLRTIERLREDYEIVPLRDVAARLAPEL